MMNINIIQEIKINGNTNHITKSNLISGSEIYAIGDSHSIFFYNSMKIKEHWFYGNHNLPLTIYKLINNADKLDIYNIGTILGNGHEKYNIKKNDYVLFFFGYNDIQKNISKYSNYEYKSDISHLIASYIKIIIELKTKYEINPIVPCIYPNPRLNAVGVNCIGKCEDRRKYTEFANSILKDLCCKNNLPFLDIYNIITDKDGYIKSDITSDSIHLDYNNLEIRNIVETEIYKFCK